MTFPHTSSGLVRGDFTFILSKNGEVVKSVAVELREIADSVYVASFENDGDDYANWNLIAFETASPTRKYIESWQVRKKTMEQMIKQIRARQDSDGGFLQPQKV